MAPQPRFEPLRRWDPERIGSYALLGRLGAGAMGQVYLGRSKAGRLVAVKTIKIEFAEEPGFRARFAHEVAAARRVSGVFTAAVIAADPEADVPWLATAYIPAPSLIQLVQTCGPLPVTATKWLAAGCAEALESIHSAGLVHRDLKPSNVLVSLDGPRVIDFGVARAVERIQLTVTHGAVGTPAYMAPEQARDTRQASVASDVFSLGATLLYAATGHPPYQGETVMDVLVRLATEAPDLTGLPTELTDLVVGCLERSPRRRPTSTGLLTGLGPFVEAAADSSSDQPYLTKPALALIAEYQRSPQPAGHASGDGAQATDDASEEATFGSHTALRAVTPLRARHRLWRRIRFRGTGPPAAPLRRFPRAPRQRHKALTAAGLAVSVVALVAAGAFLGSSLTATAGKAQNSTTPGQFPPGPPPPGPNPGPLPTGVSDKPKLEVSQPFGDGETIFVIHGSGWVPFTHVTVDLAGYRVSPIRPVADLRGTFNYAINQSHEFFRGRIPPGTYLVVVAGTGGRRAHIGFQVGQQLGPGTGPPPGGSPPAAA
ncbi:MAG TPA: serine/threonine-protein kinase [Streptosporangiaceae bacterium]